MTSPDCEHEERHGGRVANESSSSMPITNVWWMMMKLYRNFRGVLHNVDRFHHDVVLDELSR